MAVSTLEIKETILIETRQVTGNVGQTDPSPRIKPATRLVVYGTATAMMSPRRMPTVSLMTVPTALPMPALIMG